MKPDYFLAKHADDAKEINQSETGWYFCLPLEEHWYGPFGSLGEASTEYQTLMHEIGGLAPAWQRVVINGRICISKNGDLFASGDTDRECVDSLLRQLNKGLG